MVAEESGVELVVITRVRVVAVLRSKAKVL